jgi:hypothetical protein
MFELADQLKDLVDGAAPPITVQEVQRHSPQQRSVGRSTKRSRARTVGFASVAAALTAVAAVVALVVVAQPTTHRTGKTTISAFPTRLPVGDQLRLIADRVAEQPILQIQADQALFTQANLSVLATVNTGAAEATIGLSVQKWSTAAGQTCTTITAQPAQFASAAEQSAWVGLNLLTLPNPPHASQCLQPGGGAVPPDAITGAGQLINVSSLPTDPSTLANELETATTGIPALDQLLADEAAPNPAFQRAALLLIGPVVGATPQFNAALYQAIALLPGVTALGPTTTQDGQSGEGYASGPGTGQSTIVVDPSTGQLLEVRGLDDSDSLTSIAVNYLNGGPMLVNAYSDQLQWLDPVGSPSVVDLSNLPTGLPVYVFATLKLGLSYQQELQPVQHLARPYFSYFKSDQSNLTVPSNPTSPAVFQWSFAAPSAVVNQFMKTLRGSGLFSSVSEI